MEPPKGPPITMPPSAPGMMEPPRGPPITMPPSSAIEVPGQVITAIVIAPQIAIVATAAQFV